MASARLFANHLHDVAGHEFGRVLEHVDEAVQLAHLVQQIKAQEEILDRMKEDGEGDFGSVIWIKDLEKKLTNMKRALDLKPKDAPVRVFPDGISIGGGNSYNKGSSVDETE